MLIDGDAEPDVAKKYGVRGFPAVKFLRSNGEAIGGFVGFVSHDRVMGSTKNALKTHGPVRFSKAYKKLYKADLDLKKAMKKEKYANALKAIATIESVGRECEALVNARKVKKEITELAKKRFAEAEEFAKAGNTDKAIRALKKLQKEFKGHDLADKAKARVKELDTAK